MNQTHNHYPGGTVEAHVCHHPQCDRQLTLQERLFGRYCIRHNQVGEIVGKVDLNHLNRAPQR